MAFCTKFASQNCATSTKTKTRLAACASEPSNWYCTKLGDLLVQVAFVHFDESHHLGVGVATPEIIAEELIEQFGGVIGTGALATLGAEVIQNPLGLSQGIEFIITEGDSLGVDSHSFHVHFPFLSGTP